ncbi:DUF2515 domain-containing protein [Sediminibacillus dalangtanensis]|uniref:DUF2515 domain-containing protein n=1 Tax=Sediminibacillus dalangtanensis TaxID=2729421 RepID=A0ABX7VRR6_9BACI|nr:DUF2515 family protein [Sediminibacillus dalangtanensis]QTM99622.1 DUF2515 domain-containing protein [Sediminibacillus dalangtanensis]
MWKEQQELVRYIDSATQRANVDNVARTKAYLAYYNRHPEITWSFLASMVSRNAGWNITDLYTPVMAGLLPKRTRKRLFSTYERANWLIFSDAYPQLLIYQFSKEQGGPLFHLLQQFNVSLYMRREWKHFWENKNGDRLMQAQIINEQNIIQRPVIEHPYFRKKVFMRLPYLVEDFFLLSAVLFPQHKGSVIGSYVYDFSNLNKRILLGKTLAAKLFDPSNFSNILEFANTVEPTGSRSEYEDFLEIKHPSFRAPDLRAIIKPIEHQDNIREDWSVNGGIKPEWLLPPEVTENDRTFEHFYRKRRMLALIWQVKQSIWT